MSPTAILHRAGAVTADGAPSMVGEGCTRGGVAGVGPGRAIPVPREGYTGTQSQDHSRTHIQYI